MFEKLEDYISKYDSPEVRPLIEQLQTDRIVARGDCDIKEIVGVNVFTITCKNKDSRDVFGTTEFIYLETIGPMNTEEFKNYVKQGIFRGVQ